MFYLMIDSLTAASRALYCFTDVHVADSAVLGSGEAGKETGFLALISSHADETAPNKRNRALYEVARLGPQLASPCANLRPWQKRAMRLRGLIDNHLRRERQRHWEAHLSVAAVQTTLNATSRTAGRTMNDLCPPGGGPGLLVVSPRHACVTASRVFRKAGLRCWN
jgi:hypothetical protein